MKTFILGYVFFLVAMLAIDAVWLVTMSKRLYKPRIGELMAESPRAVPAVIFYLIYALGASLLVVVPAVNDDKGYLVVFLLGALLGLVAYGTYDLTNQASLKTWPTLLTVVDLAWGSLLTGVVCIISTALTRLIV